MILVVTQGDTDSLWGCTALGKKTPPTKLTPYAQLSLGDSPNPSIKNFRLIKKTTKLLQFVVSVELPKKAQSCIISDRYRQSESPSNTGLSPAIRRSKGRGVNFTPCASASPYYFRTIPRTQPVHQHYSPAPTIPTNMAAITECPDR